MCRFEYVSSAFRLFYHSTRDVSNIPPPSSLQLYIVFNLSRSSYTANPQLPAQHSSLMTYETSSVKPVTINVSKSDPTPLSPVSPSAPSRTQSEPHSGQKSPSSPAQRGTACRHPYRSVPGAFLAPRTHCACSCTSCSR